MRPAASCSSGFATIGARISARALPTTSAICGIASCAVFASASRSIAPISPPAFSCSACARSNVDAGVESGPTSPWSNISCPSSFSRARPICFSTRVMSDWIPPAALMPRWP